MQSLLIRCTPAQKLLIKYAASKVGISLRRFVTYSAFEAVAQLRNANKPSNRLRKRLGLPIVASLPKLNAVFDRNSKRSMRKPLPHIRMKRVSSSKTLKAALK